MDTLTDKQMNKLKQQLKAAQERVAELEIQLSQTDMVKRRLTLEIDVLSDPDMTFYQKELLKDIQMALISISDIWHSYTRVEIVKQEIIPNG